MANRPEIPGTITIGLDDYLDALVEASEDGPAVSPHEPLTKDNAAQHAAAAALRATPTPRPTATARLEPEPTPSTPDSSPKLQPLAQSDDSGSADTQPQRPTAQQNHEELMARIEQRREEHWAEVERQIQDREARLEAARQRHQERLEETKEQSPSQLESRVELPVSDDSVGEPGSESVDYPAARGRYRSVNEKRILTHLRSALEDYEEDRGRSFPHNIDVLFQDGLVKASALVSPAAGYQLPDDFKKRNKIQQGWWVRRFSSVVLLRERPVFGSHGDESKRIRAFTRTFLNAPADEQRGAVLWSDGKITLETDWSVIDDLLQKQERKTTAELIADPMPNFPR